ncbi:MAG: FtsX-like permease family protein, partial [Candidatus Humimicrobiaceae bacterium]
MRIPKYDLKIFRDFKRSKFQFIAIIIIIILGVGLYIGLSGSFLDLSTSYKYTYDRLNLADFSITVAAAPETVVEKVKGMENVLQASGQLEYETGYERASYDRAILKLSGIEPGKKVNKIHVLEGRNFKNSEEKKVGIIISQFAEYNGIEVGDNINLNINNREVNIEIIGKASSPDNIVVVMGKENPMPSPSVYGILYMPLGQLQEITGATNRINKIDVIVENSQKLNYTLENVKQKLESYNIISDVKQEDFPSVKMLRLDLEGLDELSKFFPILFFIIASFSIYIMLARLIMSQRREIGVARAIGYSRRQILFHYVKYALYIVIIGSILGVAFGLLITRTITIFYAQALGIPFIKNQIYYGVIFQGFIISLVFGIVSAVLPARFTLSIKPAESMRMEQEGRLSFRPNSLSEKIIRGMLKFSLIAKLAIRNIFRNKKRTFFTVIGMVFSIILLFVSISMFDSTEGMLDKWLNKVTRWDIKAIGSKNIPEDEIEDIESWQGVTLVEPIIEKKAKFKKGYQEYDGSVKGIIKDSKLHQFSPVNYPVAELETGKAMLNLGLKYKMDIKPGDYLTLETEAGDQMTFEVIDFTDEMVGISAYIT